MTDFRPMLAAKYEEKHIKFPVYASAKIDGIRAVVKDGLLLSRSLKPIPNTYVQDLLGKDMWNGLDGELTVGPANHKNVMQATTSGLMSEQGEPEFTFWVFDLWNSNEKHYLERLVQLEKGFADGYFQQWGLTNARIQCLEQFVIATPEELHEYQARMLGYGFEGVMLRNPHGLYKYGRSTAREGHLVKLKQFTDAEAMIIGYEEKMHNSNESMTDRLGYTKRSSHLANMVPMNTLGALKVRDITTGVEFNIGSGFNDLQRQDIWNHRDQYFNAIVTYKHFETGVKVAPRFPIFKGFRDLRDMEQA